MKSLRNQKRLLDKVDVVILQIDMQSCVVLHALKAWPGGLEYFHEIAH